MIVLVTEPIQDAAPVSWDELVPGLRALILSELFRHIFDRMGHRAGCDVALVKGDGAPGPLSAFPLTAACQTPVPSRRRGSPDRCPPNPQITGSPAGGLGVMCVQFAELAL